MKRVLVLLLCLLMSAAMLAAMAEGDPFEQLPEGNHAAAEGSANAIEIVIDGNATPLSFDASTEFSSIMDGTVQASFYAYSANSEYLYELYMIFPVTVQSGSTLTPEYALQHDPDCSVVLILSSKEKEQYFFAGQSDGKIYPDNSTYTMTFDTVSATESSRTYAGTLSASLAAMDPDTGTPLVPFEIQNAPFRFTIPVSQTPEENPFGDVPEDLPDAFDPRPMETPTAAPDTYRV